MEARRRIASAIAEVGTMGGKIPTSSTASPDCSANVGRLDRIQLEEGG
jgi:hypothetical protein